MVRAANVDSWRGHNWVALRLGYTMKNERRHELQQNSLAAWIEQSIGRLKPYSTVITIGVVAVVALTGVSYFLSAQNTSGQLAAWDQYLEAVDEQGYDRLAELGDQFSDSNVGLCSLLIAADRQLQIGVDASFRDRTAAAQDLRMALDNYTQVAENADDPLLRQRGLIGKAYVEESLAYDSADYLRAAGATYEQYLADFPDGVYAKLVRIRLADLGNPATASFYDWFATQGMPSSEAFDDLPGLGTGIELDTLPDGPDSSSSILDPSFDDETTTEEDAEMEEPATEEPATEEPATEEPATEEPATEEPATEEPATEEPATEEPATEEPATEEPATEEAATEEPSGEDEAPAEESSADEPTTEEPVAEEPESSDDPTPESSS